jgi:hypothetical protein
MKPVPILLARNYSYVMLTVAKDLRRAICMGAGTGFSEQRASEGGGAEARIFFGQDHR